jgi:hypothetical protein
MEPYDDGVKYALWKTIESSSSDDGGDTTEDEDEDEDPKKTPKGYYKKKIPIKKIFSTILVEEELIPE